MTPSELKEHVLIAREDSHFFDRDTMRYFGDTMSNYGVRSTAILSMYNAHGEYTGRVPLPVEVWELYRKRPVKHGVQTSAYFAKDTFRQMFGTRVKE